MPDPEQEPYVAVVVSVPAQYFADDDDICHAAGTHVAQALQACLVKAGHQIPDWVEGGCREDWGVYLESEIAAKTMRYAIEYFPHLSPDQEEQMMIQYDERPGCPDSRRPLLADDPLHDTMRGFAEGWPSHRLLTQADLERDVFGLTKGDDRPD